LDANLTERAKGLQEINFKVFSLLKMDLPENNNGGVFSLTTAVTDHREKAKLAA